jgi:L-ascorbate metabolism protein UlaG (beta-lactamase superfamily)
MKIKYYGHAAFCLTTDKGTRIITDPYESGGFGGALSYGKITEAADIVLTTHDHADHNYTGDIKGPFTHIRTAGSHTAKDVTVRGIPCFHDPSKGNERGNNLIFIVEADGLKVAHLGDLGHTLDKSLSDQIGTVDVLFMPVGGFFTIDAQEADQVQHTLKPSLTIPMHFKTDKVEFPIAPVTEFTKGKKGVRFADVSEIEVTRGTLPVEPEILVLKHAL